MNQIRVLHFIPGYNYGGIETTTKNICNYLKNSKVKIEILVEKQEDMSPIEELKDTGCVVHVIEKMNKKHILRYIKQIFNFFRINDSFNIVHSYNIVRTPILFLAAKYTGIQNRIYHASTTLSSTSIFERIIFRVFIYIGTVLASQLLACSEEAGKYFFRNKKTKIIKNGINTKKFLFNVNTRNRMRANLGIKNNDYVIGHIGRFCEAKNHNFIIDLFVEVYKQIPEARLLLIGDGPTKKMIENKIRSAGIDDRVILTGAVSNANDYLQAMDIFVFPSIYEGFGNVAVEAQAAGLKVIASDKVPKSVKITDLVEFLPIDQGINRWVNLLIKSRHHLSRKNMYDEIIRSGFDIERNVLELEEFYIKLASN